MEIDEYMRVASAGAKSIYGDKATIAVEESSICTPENVRWRAFVKVRGEVVTSKRGPQCSDVVRALAKELAEQARAFVDAHRTADLLALSLGL